MEVKEVGRSANDGDDVSRSGGGSSRSSGGHRHSSVSRTSRGADSRGNDMQDFLEDVGKDMLRGAARNMTRNIGYRGTRGFYGGQGSYGGYSSGRGGVIGIVIALVLLVLAAGMGGKFVLGGKQPSGVMYSSVQREKLDTSNVVETSYIDDRLGWISSKYKVEQGMKYFYKKTGVQPYLIITDSIDDNSKPTDAELDAYLNDFYSKTFNDEQHIVVLYLDNGKDWLTYYMCGKQAKAVIDSEAGEILLSFLDTYATSDMEDDEYFSKSFHDAADRIMTYGKRDTRWFVLIGAAVAVVAGVVVVIVVIRNKRKKEELELEQLRESRKIFDSGNANDNLKNKYN